MTERYNLSGLQLSLEQTHESLKVWQTFVGAAERLDDAQCDARTETLGLDDSTGDTMKKLVADGTRQLGRQAKRGSKETQSSALAVGCVCKPLG